MNSPSTTGPILQMAGGAKFEYATDLIVRNNFAHDNNGAGPHTDGDSCKRTL